MQPRLHHLLPKMRTKFRSRHPCRPLALITSWPYLLETWRSEVCKHRRTGFTGIIPQAIAQAIAVCGDRWAVYFNPKIDPAEFVSMFCGDYVPQAFLDTLRIPDMPVLKHPALHGGHVVSSHSDMAWSSSMLQTGFRADFFHQPVTVEDFILNRTPTSLSVVSSVPVAECLKRVKMVSSAHKKNYTSPHLAIWTGVDNHCKAATGRCCIPLRQALGRCVPVVPHKAVAEVSRRGKL